MVHLLQLIVRRWVESVLVEALFAFRWFYFGNLGYDDVWTALLFSHFHIAVISHFHLFYFYSKGSFFNFEEYATTLTG